MDDQWALYLLIVAFAWAYVATKMRAEKDAAAQKEEERRRAEEFFAALDNSLFALAAGRGHEMGPPYVLPGDTVMRDHRCENDKCTSEVWRATRPQAGHLFGGHALLRDCPYRASGRSFRWVPLQSLYE